MAQEKWGEGKLVNAARGVPGSFTDCSGWEADIPAERWSTGKLVSAAKGVPGSSTDCSGWDAGLPVCVTIHVSPAAADDAPRVVALLRSLSPELGLEHDPARSVEPAAGRRVVAVTPTVPLPDLKARLYALLPKVEEAKSNLPIVNVGIELGRPSAA